MLTKKNIKIKFTPAINHYIKSYGKEIIIKKCFVKIKTGKRVEIFIGQMSDRMDKE